MPVRRNVPRNNPNPGNKGSHSTTSHPISPPPPPPPNASHGVDQRQASFSIIVAVLLITYLSGSATVLLSRLVATFPADFLRWMLFSMSCLGALLAFLGDTNRPQRWRISTQRIVEWTLIAVSSLFLRETVFAASYLFLSGTKFLVQPPPGNEDFFTAVMFPSIMTTLFGCGLPFLLLGWKIGREFKVLLSEEVTRQKMLVFPYWVDTALTLAALVVLLGPLLSYLWPFYPVCVGPNLTAIISICIATYGSNFAPPSRHGTTRKQRNFLVRIAYCLIFTSAVTRSLLCMGYDLVGTTEYAPHISKSARKNSFTTLQQFELKHGGFLSVVEGTLPSNNNNNLPDIQYRAMRLDHSIMGGYWIAPEEFKGQSIYTAFYLQAAMRIFLPPTFKSADAPGDNHNHKNHQQQMRRSLHIGLGAGTAVTALQRHGFISDVIELHPEVIEAAQEYFNVHPKGQVIAQDALKAVPKILSSSAQIYDLVILDVFSGGSEGSQLTSQKFFNQLKGVLMPYDGVLAVNFAGFQGILLDDLLWRMKMVFPAVRCFAEAINDDDDIEERNNGSKDEKSAHFRNFVVVGFMNESAGRIDVTAAAQDEIRRINIIHGDNTEEDKTIEAEVLNGMADNEMNIDWDAVGNRCSEEAKESKWEERFQRWDWRQKEASRAAGMHWAIMREQFGNQFWTL